MITIKTIEKTIARLEKKLRATPGAYSKNTGFGADRSKVKAQLEDAKFKKKYLLSI